MNNKVTDNELEGYCLTLVNTLIKAYYGEDDTEFENDDDDHEIIDSIVDYATQIVLKIKKSLNNENLEVYLADIVILSIDNNPPEAYLLTNNPNFNAVVGIPDPTNKFKYQKYEILPVSTVLGKELLGKHEGNIIRYSDDSDKNEHQVEIIKILRTISSRKLCKYEIEAEESFDHKHKK